MLINFMTTGEMFDLRNWIRETRYECGDYLDVDIYPVHAKTLNRRKKAKPTSETQQKLNDMRAEKKLVRIANANFTTGDIKGTLTFDDKHYPGSDEEAARRLSAFFRRVKRYRASKGLDELKYIVVTEKGARKGRIHFHLIMNGGIDQQEIYDLWDRQGTTEVAALIFDENGIQTLVDYMLKQAREFEGKKKYSRSRNLIVPEPKRRDNRFSKKDKVKLAKLLSESGAPRPVPVPPSHRTVPRTPTFPDRAPARESSSRGRRQGPGPDRA